MQRQKKESFHPAWKLLMHRKGVAVMEIVAQTGLSWTAVNKALRLYKTEGSGALKPCVRGKKPGSGRRLTITATGIRLKQLEHPSDWHHAQLS